LRFIPSQPTYLFDDQDPGLSPDYAPHHIRGITAAVSHNQVECTMLSNKEEVATLLEALPDDCSVEDIQYHLYVLEKVRRGLERADTEGTVSQEDAEARLSRWIIE
jgi:hypothetical protein